MFVGRYDNPINYVEIPEVTHYFKLFDGEKILSNSKICLVFQLPEALEEHSFVNMGVF